MFKPDEGAVSFVEFYSKDPPVTKEFLEKVFGWKMTKTVAGGVDIWIFEAGNGSEGHLMAPMGLSPGTVAFVRVKSVDAVSKKVEENGGKILVPKFEVPGMGWFTYFRAPGGNSPCGLSARSQASKKVGAAVR
jgi:uncharacterized protein